MTANGAKCGDYLCVCGLCDFPEVILRPGGDLSKENLLSHSTPQHHAHSVKELLAGEQELLLRQILCITQTFPSGNYGHLRAYIKKSNHIINIIICLNPHAISEGKNSKKHARQRVRHKEIA